MDFKISSGSGSNGKCPKCNRKYLPIIREGNKLFVCSCGWQQIIKKYPTNQVETNQILKR